MSGEERFNLLSAKLEEATRDSAANAEMIAQLREQHEQNGLNQILNALKYVLLHRNGQRDGLGEIDGRGKQATLKWYERGPLFWVFLPIK